MKNNSNKKIPHHKVFINMKHEINEEYIMETIRKVISEETSKVNRNDYNKVQFKMDELESQLAETVKELRKVQDCIPEGLRTISSNRLSSISSNLNDANKTLKVLKNKIKDHKRGTYQQQVDEKKK
jgi:esterase/lipase